jgi:hypothetical protein
VISDVTNAADAVVTVGLGVAVVLRLLRRATGEAHQDGDDEPGRAVPMHLARITRWKKHWLACRPVRPGVSRP